MRPGTLTPIYIFGTDGPLVLLPGGVGRGVNVLGHAGDGLRQRHHQHVLRRLLSGLLLLFWTLLRRFQDSSGFSGICKRNQDISGLECNNELCLLKSSPGNEKKDATTLKVMADLPTYR